MIDPGKVDRFVALMERFRDLTPEQRQAVVDAGKEQPEPKVRRFFELLEVQLRARGHLPPEKGVPEK